MILARQERYINLYCEDIDNTIWLDVIIIPDNAKDFDRLFKIVYNAEVEWHNTNSQETLLDFVETAITNENISYELYMKEVGKEEDE